MDEKYLSMEELLEITKYKKQSIYNLINRGVFVKGVHFLKPSSRKLIFRHSAIMDWLGVTESINNSEDALKVNEKTLINI
jgi:predicted DNA-binding transcriptional regulator AlpA